jgi:peptide/nickel transport system permease protein
MVAMLGLSIVVNAALEATVRSQIVESAQAAVMGNKSLKTPEEIIAFKNAVIEGMERSFGLFEPRWKRILDQTYRIVRLDLGEARYDRTEYPERSRSVRRIILQRLPHTLVLFSASTLISIVLGIALGTLMARKPGEPLDRGSSLAAMALYGTPTWWVATFMILFFVYTVPVFKVGALRSPVTPDGTIPQMLDYLAYLALPLLTLVLVKVWSFAYLTRAMVTVPLQEDYVMAARGRGIPEGKILRRHGLRVAAPGLTTMAAQAFAQSIMGDMLVEKAMSRPGLGMTLFSAILANDVALYTGILAVVTAIYCLSFMLLDIAYAWLDPRIGYGRT